MKNYMPKYFLGANSCEGFFSAFKESYLPAEGWRAYLIKGGPGTGKSSFMKYVAAKAEKRGLFCELCVCSSDPDSLDGVIIPEIKTVLLDATAPHTVEPKYVGACEIELDLGLYRNSKMLKKNAERVIAATDKNHLIHRTASRYLSAAGELMLDNLRISADCTDTAAAEALAERICRRSIPERQTSAKPREQVRFIEGITPRGIVAYCRTVSEGCNRIVAVEDRFGSVSGIIMRYVRRYALEHGYDIITLKNPFLPSMLDDHIIIPELSLAFVTENEYLSFDADVRRIHARRFCDVRALKMHRGRMTFNRRAARELLMTASQALARAKTAHDELEKLYIEAMDFERLSRDAVQLAEEILQK